MYSENFDVQLLVRCASRCAVSCGNALKRGNAQDVELVLRRQVELEIRQVLTGSVRMPVQPEVFIQCIISPCDEDSSYWTVG